MMKNNFKKNNYTGYHEFSCLYCEHIIKPKELPDTEKTTRCGKNGISLRFLINDDGYFIPDEWFCREISNRKFPGFHVKELNAIKNELKPGCMYLLDKENIKEVSFKELGIAD